MKTEIKKIVKHTFVEKVHYYPEISSTNDFALNLAQKKKIKSPELIWVAKQNSGRGRFGRRWFDDHGALIFSLLLPTKVFNLQENLWPRVSLLSAEALARALEIYVPKGALSLKWPNDVYLKEKKCAGILLEAAKPHALIIGMGVNVFNPLEGFPERLKNSAINLISILRNPPELHVLLISILRELEKLFVVLHDTDFDLRKIWLPRCFLNEKVITLSQGDQIIKGHCKSINKDGALLVDCDGVLEKYYTGNIQLIPS